MSDKNLPPLIRKLAEGIERKGLAVKFGLEQQGCIETIERILDDLGSNEHSWEKIGKEIGWCPRAACNYYVTYLRSSSPTKEMNNR